MSDPNDSVNPLLRAMAEASPLAMAVCEGPEHVLRYVNPAFCRLHAKSASDLLGLPFAEAVPKGAAHTPQTLLNRVFQTGTAGSLADLDRSRPGSDPAYLRYTAWPLLDEGGVATQITDAMEGPRAAEEARGDLQRANQQLLLAALREEQRAEALLLADRAKDEFLAMLAHELRNPLAAIGTDIYLLEQRAGPADTDTQETCGRLERQIRHVSRLLEDLLDVSRITEGKINLRLERVDLVTTVRRVAEGSRSLLQDSRHELSLALPSTPVWVDGDPVRLEQVVTNLLNNAIKYMNPGGRVDLSVAVERDEVRAENFSTPDLSSPPQAVIRVRDAGIGMSPEALSHVFDLFMQVDHSLVRAQGGLGIGLTLVRRLVDLHGGEVAAYSAGPGLGSEFIVRLPMRVEPAGGPGSAEEPDSPQVEAAASGATILLVEDNVDGAASMAEVLELWGYEVRVAHSGKAALEAAYAAPPNVILLDIGLPGEDGYQVAQQLRAQPALDETLLVALTGYAQESDLRRSREAGFDFHLTKPVELDELRRTIASRRGSPGVRRKGDRTRSQPP